jgi:nucleoside-diphosphate-sugar epimerase
MRLLIIGHGYLGSAVAAVFRSGGWTVHAASLSGDDGSIACDVADEASVRSLSAAIPAPDFIVHCAASGRGGADAYRRVYVDGCANLINTFKNTPLLFTSSTSVYAQIDGSVVTESSPAIPDRETGHLLLEAESLVLAAGGIVTRLAGIYGPARSVILRKFLTGEAVIEEDGRRFLNQIHRDDAARAILHLALDPATHAGEIFNVSDSSPLTQIGCYQSLSTLFGRPLPLSGPRDLDRKRGWTHKQVSSAKLQATGWTPAFPSFLDAAPALAPTL